MITPQQQSVRYHDPSQETEEVQQVIADLQPMLTSNEELLYVAVQQRFAPSIQGLGAAVGVAKKQAVAATNQRLILYRPGLVGTARLVDIPWLEVDHVHINQGLFGTTFEVQRLVGRAGTEEKGLIEQVQYLDKAQAKRLFGICQEIEMRNREERRLRRLEEERAEAGAPSLVVNAAPPAAGTSTGAATPAASETDPVSKLAQAKAMLDQGLISPEEFANIRARIITAM